MDVPTGARQRTGLLSSGCHAPVIASNISSMWSPTVFTDLTHWGRVTHICVGKLSIIDSDNGLSPVRRQAIIWTNAGMLLIGPLGTNFSEILIEILTFSFKKMRLKVSSAKWRPFCLGLNVLTHWGLDNMLAIFSIWVLFAAYDLNDFFEYCLAVHPCPWCDMSLHWIR